LAQAYAALNKPAKALPLYQSLGQDERFAAQAAVGAAKMLDALGRTSEASEALSSFLKRNPSSGEAALKLAEIRLELGDPGAALNVLSAREFSPQQQQDASYLVARALLASGESAKAEEKLRTIKDLPARLAGGVAVALAECRLQQEDAGEAEKIMETYIEEKSRLPGLPAAFAALDRVYVYEGAASSTELRRWTADSKNGQRSALALFYLARNEARSRKGEKSRQLFSDFLAQYPSHFLADEARAELSASQIAAGRAQEALQIAQAGRGFRNSFVRGQAQAAGGRYKEAAASFLQGSGAPELEAAALENSAICALLAGIPEAENEAMRRLIKRSSFASTVERIRFFEAMRQAAKRSPSARNLLRKIADSESAYGQRARLALAEWAFLEISAEEAGVELRRISTDDPPTKERTDYLAIFQGDTGDRESEAQVAKLAETFIAQYPDSRYEAHVRMKLGETFYRRGDYLGARGQFGIVAERFSDSPLAEKAVFLTAQAMARSLDPSEMEEAIEIFEQVVKSGGPLSLRARLAQAGLLNALKRPEEALGVIDRILESKPDPELRYTALIEKGDTLFSQGAQDTENYRSAIASWKQVSGDPSAPKMWSHQALAKMGAACEKLGNYDAALDCYYGAFSQGQKGGPEYFWFYKAGFDAGRLLESQKLWKEAIAVYEKIGSVDGPRAEEARDRVNRLRLENFIWDN
ncbi:MAG TPA: tetratricopeptide repeat protein, partial [Terrimicrobiaceae bacterium]|nr:tetratricopeptide repeat protein [Terrimicrobiaceae bacterium]